MAVQVRKQVRRSLAQMSPPSGMKPFLRCQRCNKTRTAWRLTNGPLKNSGAKERLHLTMRPRFLSRTWVRLQGLGKLQVLITHDVQSTANKLVKYFRVAASAAIKVLNCIL